MAAPGSYADRVKRRADEASRDRSRLEFLRERVSALAFAAQFAYFRRAGRQWRALCPLPFHGETNPSFYVSPDRRKWYCHGCSCGGDVFSLAMEILGCDFREAVRQVARFAAGKPISLRLRARQHPAHPSLAIGARGSGGLEAPQKSAARREEIVALRRRAALRAASDLVGREAELPPCMRAALLLESKR